jgi:DedD protein
MNDGFKQRLVGAIVLVSIVLILWPVIFSEGINPAVDRKSQIVSPPAFDKFTVSAPERSTPMPVKLKPTTEPVEEQISLKQQAVIKPNVKPAIKEQPKLDSQGLPEAWVLQVASFSQRKNADEVKEALIKMGYKAYTRTIKTPEGPSTRVYVGPRFTKSAFSKDKLAIDKAFSVKSILVRFEQ